MSFLFDQNISHRILTQLSPYFSQSTSVKSQNLIDNSDFEIWDFCKKNKLHIITQDSDFNFIQSLRGFPPKVVWLRLGNQRTEKITKILNSNTTEIERFLQDQKFGILEISEDLKSV